MGLGLGCRWFTGFCVSRAAQIQVIQAADFAELQRVKVSTEKFQMCV